MLPLALTALSVLMAQMEHGPGTWHHPLPLPAARPAVFLAKALVMAGLIAAMSCLLFVLLHLAGFLIDAAAPGALAANILSMPERQSAALTLGSAGGVVVVALLCLDLSHRERA